MGNLPKRRRAGTEAGNPTRTYAVNFTLYFATQHFILEKKMGDNEKKRKIKVKSNHTGNKRFSFPWLVSTVLLTFFLSVTISFLTSSRLNDVALEVAFVILFVIIFIGILFDIIGTAVTASTLAPFHAMASNRVKGSKTAIKLIKNAEKVSNICNDVIGDICGIISGTIGAVIVTELCYVHNFDFLPVSLLVTGTISALTVGGKAMGKTGAINSCNAIVFFVSRILSVFERKKK